MTRLSSRQRTGEMTLDLKRDKEVHGKRVEVRGLTAEATLKVKNLDVIADVKELVTAKTVLRAVVRLRKGRQGHGRPWFNYLWRILTVSMSASHRRFSSNALSSNTAEVRSVSFNVKKIPRRSLSNR